MHYIEAAKQFVDRYFPNSAFALVAGSVVRGESTQTSDLDIVVVVPELERAYRESFVEFGWPIEAFVHNLESYKEFFHSDAKRRRPSLPMMCSEGIVLVDRIHLEGKIRALANEILGKGPAPYSPQEKSDQRYIITDLLDDLIGAEQWDEQMFIVQELSETMCNYVLVCRGQWMGRGKWIPRLIRKMDSELYTDLMISLDAFYRLKNKQSFIDLVMREINRYGGTLFEGYSRGKA